MAHESKCLGNLYFDNYAGKINDLISLQNKSLKAVLNMEILFVIDTICSAKHTNSPIARRHSNYLTRGVTSKAVERADGFHNKVN